MSPADKNLDPTSKISQTGQGIIEIIVVLALAAILILALVALATRSNRSTNFSKAADQAARFSQEGMEIIKGLRSSNSQTMLYADNCNNTISTRLTWEMFFEQNPSGSGINDNCDYTSTGYADIYGRIGHLQLQGTDNGSCPDPETLPEKDPYHCVNFDGDATFIETQTNDGTLIDNRNFQRAFFAADTPVALGGVSKCNSTASDWQNIKQFTVVTYWTDSSGRHESITSACIQR